eukprot:CAMPEP_0181513320 /NCGR_PEP_ID=MMETSP1110-20121109/62438_1 /TAXON_ID=174948 /ORGANISM="Symbiodinium sp., Strain CCMP421" /LENGTH=143 /DNA_ID=CAMNT_0023643183 /DNA_START=75 /DNA_END=509 /DNA_ORIENTATION=-
MRYWYTDAQVLSLSGGTDTGYGQELRASMRNVAATFSNQEESNFLTTTDEDMVNILASIIVLHSRGWRSSKAALQAMSTDDFRNTIIAELTSSGASIEGVQALSTREIADIAMQCPTAPQLQLSCQRAPFTEGPPRWYQRHWP